MLNPNEEKLANFCEDTVMYHAVKAILEAEFDLNAQVVDSVNNDILGERTRACLQGREALRRGFRAIEQFKREEIQRDTRNPNQI